MNRRSKNLGLRKLQALENKRIQGRETIRVLEYFILFLNYLRSNHVHLVGLPPHTSDLTQPMDLTVFGAFKNVYRDVLNKTRQQYQINNFHQRDFLRFLTDSYKKSFTSNIITAGFHKAGLAPFNPLRILER